MGLVSYVLSQYTVSDARRRRSGMAGSQFDALEAAETLTAAGPAEPRARAIAATMRKAVSDGVAKKGDIGAAKAELRELKSALLGHHCPCRLFGAPAVILRVVQILRALSCGRYPASAAARIRNAAQAAP